MDLFRTPPQGAVSYGLVLFGICKSSAVIKCYELLTLHTDLRLLARLQSYDFIVNQKS